MMPRTLWWSLLLLWLVPSVAHAKGLTAVIETEEPQAVVGETITVDFIVSKPSLRASLPTPSLPASVAEDFDVGDCSGGVPMRSRKNVNGAVSVATTRRISCPLTARKAGTFKLAFTVPDGKKTVASNSIEIEVFASQEDRTPLEDPTVEVPSDVREDVFPWVSVDKTRAYVGEQITFRLDVYEARRFLDVSLRTSPTFEGFISEELPLPEMYTTELSVVEDGEERRKAFRVRPGIRRALFPQRAGEATIGASELLISRRRKRYSAPIEIDILPLPAEGQPADFSANNVGQYQISAKVDREDVQPGEPFTLTYTIAGEGNIELVEPGAWADVPGVRTYDPKVTTQRSRGAVVGGTRSYAFLMIPERPGTITIEPHELSYFDPETESYETASTQAIEVVVGGDPNAILPDEDPSEQPGSVVDDPLAPVLSVETVPRQLPRTRWLTPPRWMLAMLAIPALVGIGLGGGWAWRRFGPDDVARSRALARARRRKRIEDAQAAVESGEGFHGAVAALLHDAALGVAGSEGTGLPRPELLRLIERRGVEAEERRRLESLLDQCDAARFGAAGGGVEERHMLLDDALSLVRSLGKGTA